ncbi:MAG: M20/M25/M40 family metallo-hydrolase [Clostridiaceae bacterium]|nr:M20/M25/M40 family metallo-hydrolase [Clostridiaceae bacterium]
MDAIKHLQDAIRLATVSHSDPYEADWSAFREFGEFMAAAYPLIHEKMELQRVNDFGLVYRWPGSSEEKPLLLTAHYDVVAATDEDWQHPPFSGHDDGEKIWGRGTLDDKGSLIAIMEAANSLLEADYIPPYDIYFAFGFDEEVGGELGAQEIANYFQKKKIHFRYVLDEGGAVTEGKSLGVAPDLAVIGIAEKGNNSLRFLFRGEEGHSATPPKSSAVGKMAAFIHDVENKPPKLRITETLAATLGALAPFKSKAEAFVLRNPQLFAPILARILLKNKQTAAMLRSTIAFTMTEAGTGHNILPRTASCVANIRILQGDTVEGILDHLRSLGHDFEIAEKIMINEATAISDVNGEGMQHTKETIAKIFPDAVALPYLMVGGTDCRYYDQVADNAYRFLPNKLSGKELDTMHGRGECISHENFYKMIEFYTEFMLNLR